MLRTVGDIGFCNRGNPSEQVGERIVVDVSEGVEDALRLLFPIGAERCLQSRLERRRPCRERRGVEWNQPVIETARLRKIVVKADGQPVGFCRLRRQGPRRLVRTQFERKLGCAQFLRDGRIELHRLAVIGNRRAEVLRAEVSVSALVIGTRQLRAGLDRPREVGDRGIEIAPLCADTAPAQMGSRAARIELDRLVVVAQCKLDFVAALIGGGPTAIGLGTCRVDADGLGVIGNGLFGSHPTRGKRRPGCGMRTHCWDRSLCNNHSRRSRCDARRRRHAPRRGCCRRWRIADRVRAPWRSRQSPGRCSPLRDGRCRARCGPTTMSDRSRSYRPGRTAAAASPRSRTNLETSP